MTGAVCSLGELRCIPTIPGVYYQTECLEDESSHD